MTPRRPNIYDREGKLGPYRDEPFDPTGEEGSYDLDAISDEGSDPEKILLDKESGGEQEEEGLVNNPEDDEIPEDEEDTLDAMAEGMAMDDLEDAARAGNDVYGEGLDGKGRPIDRPVEEVVNNLGDDIHPSHSGFSSRELTADRESKWNRTHIAKKKRHKGGETIRKD